jgi:3-oxoacyl-[acyl-carrier-protein] synthase II
VSRVGIAGFGAMRAISRRNDDPRAASRPFDAERDGFVMGEAGAMIVLEDLEHARARGAKIYAELLGYGVSSDATHVSDPDPTGQSPARALDMAFTDAGISPDEVGYINAHGTSTPVGDSAETRVIKLALGEEKAYRTPISSTKGATGHCLGAAGAVEASFTILALERGVLPPTINQEVADPECDLDYIPNEARTEQVEIGVSNSFGFGGHNACVVFRRWQSD